MKRYFVLNLIMETAHFNSPDWMLEGDKLVRTAKFANQSVGEFKRNLKDSKDELDVGTVKMVLEDIKTVKSSTGYKGLLDIYIKHSVKVEDGSNTGSLELTGLVYSDYDMKYLDDLRRFFKIDRGIDSNIIYLQVC